MKNRIKQFTTWISFIIFLFLSLQVNAQRKYIGVFREGKDGYALWAGVEWDSFVKKWGELAKQNLRLVEIETYTEGDKRLYNGVFRQGKDGYALWAGVEWDSFVKKWEELAKQNLRLVDIETYSEGGKRLYIGVFRQGKDGYALWAGVEWDSFVKKWEELAKQNLRLVDIETYSEGGKRLYIGVFRQGKDGYALWAGVEWDSFVKKWEELAKQNLRLVDIETYSEGGKRLYIGVFRQGKDGYALWAGVEWDSFVKKWEELAKQNLKLVNISSYIDPLRMCIDWDNPPEPNCPSCLTGVTQKFWSNGTNLRVHFENGTQLLKDKVMKYANEWTQYANVKFTASEDGNCEIIIKFDKDGNCWSKIGTDAIDKGFRTIHGWIIAKETMHFGCFNEDSDDVDIRSTVLHEFGHAIGFIHEHQNPDAGIPWDKEAVYKEYTAPPRNWSKDKIDDNIFERYDRNQTQFTSYDPTSIMHYPIDDKLTIGNFSAPWNAELSGSDIAFAKAIYPPGKISGSKIRIIVNTGVMI